MRYTEHVRDNGNPTAHATVTAHAAIDIDVVTYLRTADTKIDWTHTWAHIDIVLGTNLAAAL